MQAAVPRVEVADDGNRARVRRPHGERGAGDAVELADVRAELLVQLLVAALHDEMQVELAERRQERVRIAQRERVAVRILDLDLVLERQLRLREHRLPEAGGILQLRLDGARLHAHRPRLGAERAHDDAAVRLVRAENGVRVGAELDHAVVGSSMSRWMPRTGMPTQSGRLSSSYWSSYTAFSSSNTASSRSIADCPAGSSDGSTVSK